MLDKLDWCARDMRSGALLSIRRSCRTGKLARVCASTASLNRFMRRWALCAAAFRAREAKTMLADADMAAMAREELLHLDEEIPACEREIQLLLLPRDPNDERSVVMEIRGGAGGEEAALFGAMLMRMYTRYAERHGWRVEMMDANMTELGGVKEASHHRGRARFRGSSTRSACTACSASR